MHAKHTAPNAKKQFGDFLGEKIAPAAPAAAPATSAADTVANKSPFHQWWAAGYRDLIPVVPPDAPLSEKSHIALNKSAGKAPGVRYPNGLWGNFKGWNGHRTTEADLDKWGAMGASVGLRRGTVLALDIDATDEKTADAIEKAAIEELGPAPVRIGRWPKRMLLYRFEGGVPGKLTFEGPGGAENQIEFPMQTVIEGIHPGTGEPYRWPHGHRRFDELTEVSGEQLDAFLERQREILPVAKKHKSGAATDRETIDQNNLRGDPATVRRAVEAIPNSGREFADRDAYIRIGAAIKAAIPDDDQTAFAIFEDWCAKWQDGENTPETIAADWRRLKPPFEIGAKWLYKIANGLAPDRFNVGEVWFKDYGVEPLPPEDIGLNAISKRIRDAYHRYEDRNGAARERDQHFDFNSATRLKQGWQDNIRPKEFTLGTRFQPGVITIGIGAPGVSKSTFAILSALAIASGKNLTGEHVHRSGPVLIYGGEEPLDELKRRVAAAARYHGIDLANLGEKVRVLSGPDQRRLVFAERLQRNGTIQPGRDVPALMAFVRQEGIVHVVLDPLIGLHRGLEENSSSDMEALGDAVRSFVTETAVSVDLIHHSRKGSSDREAQAGSADAARGSGAIAGFVRSAYTLSPMSEKTAKDLGLGIALSARLVRLDDAKRNNTRRASTERWFEITSVSPKTGARVMDSQFDSRDPVILRSALETVGVHVPYDIAGRRHTARVRSMIESEERDHEARLWLIREMPEAEMPRTDTVRRYCARFGVKETAGRKALERLAPEGHGAAADVSEPNGAQWRIWAEQRNGRRGRAWVIRRERVGQVAELPAAANAPEVFD